MLSLLGEMLSLIWSILKAAFLILKTFTTIKVQMIAFVLGVPTFIAWIVSKLVHFIKN